MIYVAMGEIAHETSQVLGAFVGEDHRCAEERCRQRDPNAGLENVYDRYWIEKWTDDGSYVCTYDVLPDGSVAAHP